jgi:acetyl-CoA C-acetyltransferase
MRRVSIVGLGQSPVACTTADTADGSLAALAGEALAAALSDAAGIRPQAVYLSAAPDVAAGQVVQIAGLDDVAVPVISAVGCSGGVALHKAVQAVASGQVDAVAAAGAGGSMRMPDSGQDMMQAAEYALIMRRYMYDYSWHSKHFATFVISACRNALGNSYAANGRHVSADAYTESPMLVDPINTMDAARTCRGAACVIICASEIASHLAPKPVAVTASVVVADAPAFYDRSDILFPDGMAASAQTAYTQAGRSPGDIDMFEAYDAFSILAALSLETAGFASKGSGVRLAQEGAIALQGRIPMSTLGGLIGRGNVPEANALYQAVDAALQLRGEAGASQVTGVRCALLQSMAGDATCVATHILETQPA